MRTTHREPGCSPATEASEPDFETGLRWARKAAEGGSADGQAVLGYILTSGPEPMRDLDEAHRCYERSAAAGSPQGALGYALSLARTAPAPEQQTQVAEHLRRAADAGLPTALYLLALMTERGMGMPADRAAAIQLFRQAAEKGNRPSQARWGMALMEGHDVPANPIEGESWLRRAALAGDPEAAAVVGDLYAKGGKLPPNYAEAAMWFRRAAEAGHRGGARALGMLHLTGAGVPRDSRGGGALVPRLGRGRRSDGAGRPRQPAAARPGRRRTTRSAPASGSRQAAASGDLVAAFNFGVCLAEGVGVERDDRKAAQWLRRAADGVVNAQYWYGRMLVEGPRRGRQSGGRSRLDQARRRRRHGGSRGPAGGDDADRSRRPEGPSGALALFEKAAGRGHVGAMFAMGAMHGGGHEVPTDRPTAQRWFRAAAERGHAVRPDDAGPLSGTRPGRRA